MTIQFQRTGGGFLVILQNAAVNLHTERLLAPSIPTGRYAVRFITNTTGVGGCLGFWNQSSPATAIDVSKTNGMKPGLGPHFGLEATVMHIRSEQQGDHWFTWLDPSGSTTVAIFAIHPVADEPDW
jgi:hypothetical protein